MQRRYFDQWNKELSIQSKRMLPKRTYLCKNSRNWQRSWISS